MDAIGVPGLWLKLAVALLSDLPKFEAGLARGNRLDIRLHTVVVSNRSVHDLILDVII